MAVETELKLSLAPEHLAQLRDHPFLKSLSASSAVTQTLYSVYYDTPELELRNHAMALRLRRIGTQWIQTLKGGGGVEAGLHRRNEWEMPVRSEAIDLDALEAVGGKVPTGAAKQLAPVFVTDFSRDVRILRFEGAEIELGLDSGEIRAKGKTRQISELELELKSGDPGQLFKIALALADIVPLQVEDTSKAEYGYRLFSGERPAAREAAFPRLDPAQGVASALQAMIGACLVHVQANVSGVIGEQDGEYLQQVCIGLRRLGAVLEMAEHFRANAELTALRGDVANLAREFAAACQWDVFMRHTIAPLFALAPDDEGLNAVWNEGEAQCDEYRAGAVMTLASPAYQRLVLRLGAWMNGDYWRAAGTPPGLMDFARDILQAGHSVVLQLGKGPGDDAIRLHALWVAIATLRDSAEFFASLYALKEASHFIAGVAELQNSLDALVDVDVARRLLDELRGRVPPGTVGVVREASARDHARLRNGFGAAWKRFGEQQVMWD